MWTFSEYNDISITFLYKASLGRVLHDRVFTVKTGQKKVTKGENPSYFNTASMELAVCIQLESWDFALDALPVASISRACRGVSQWLVNPQTAAASGLSWQPQGYGHRLWMLAHTAWLLGLWLIPYHQLTLALCQCFFWFRKHGK